MHAIGLMSGTSLDGIDAALIEINARVTNGSAAPEIEWSLVSFESVPYTSAQRSQIARAIEQGTAEHICRTHADLGEWLAAAALRVAAQARLDIRSVDVIGSHGQTIWHIPPHDGRRGATLQIGCPATIAERTGVDVVSDFRARDVAANGHGAPLVPWADKLLFADPSKARVMVNIGGMANLTWVPPRGDTRDVLAFDTGPGNVLIDAAVEAATDSAQTFDSDGAIARGGQVDGELLASLMSHPFYAMQPPRSTGRELFGRGMVNDLLRADADRATGARALVATLTELTARTVADSINRFCVPRGVGEVIVTGGGARNTWMMERIRALVAPVAVRTGDDAGINADAKEAIVFAALAWAHKQGITGNVPAATGAAGPRILGSLTPGARDGQ